MKKILKNRYPWILLILLIGISGCAQRYYIPVPAQGVSSEGKYAVIRTDSLIIAVRPNVYPNLSSDFTSNYFSVWYQVRNAGEAARNLPKESLSVIADGRQYDYVPMELVLAGFYAGAIFDRKDEGNVGFDDLLLPLKPLKDTEQSIYLVRNYLSLGNLVAGGHKEGYLFYDRNIHGSRNLVIDVFGKMVEFYWGKEERAN